MSNFKPSQVNLLRSMISMPLAVNQVEINIENITTLLDDTLDQCQQHEITPIASCLLADIAYPNGKIHLPLMINKELKLG